MNAEHEKVREADIRLVNAEAKLAEAKASLFEIIFVILAVAFSGSLAFLAGRMFGWW